MPTGVTNTASHGRIKKSQRIGLLEKLYEASVDYKKAEDKLNSTWCNSTAKCKEGYEEQAIARIKINELLKELIALENTTIS